MQILPKRLIVAGALGLALTGEVMAHSPILSCFLEEDEKVLCEAGYSDGASSAGQVIRILTAEGRLVLEDKFADDGTYLFERPAEDFYVEFEGDVAHVVTFYADDLF